MEKKIDHETEAGSASVFIGAVSLLYIACSFLILTLDSTEPNIFSC